MAELRADFPAEPESDEASRAHGAESRHEDAIERATPEMFAPATLAETPVPAAAAVETLAAPLPVAQAPVEPAPVAPSAVAEPVAIAERPTTPPPPPPAAVQSPQATPSRVIASFTAPPATYQVVSEHGEIGAEPARPVRKRREDHENPAAAEPLKLVETASDKIAQLAPALDDEPSRPPVRRRRRPAPDIAEPLQLVETAPGAIPGDSEPPPA